jgi:thioredoxin 1
MMGPMIDELAEEFKGQVKVAKLNTDENQEIAGALGISAIPTILFFKNGYLVDRAVGVTAKDTLRRQINRLL